MAQMKNVEKKIRSLEGFDVVIRHAHGRDARGDMDGLPQYRYERAAKGSMTVSRWIMNRFSQTYPGYVAEVLDGNGQSSQGNCKLGGIRDTYAE
jgi:hypothetical protein